MNATIKILCVIAFIIACAYTIGAVTDRVVENKHLRNNVALLNTQLEHATELISDDRKTIYALSEMHVEEQTPKQNYTLEICRDGVVEWQHVPYSKSVHIIIADDKLMDIKTYPHGEDSE
jgi:hypothetical protein